MRERSSLSQAIYDLRWGGIPARTARIVAGVLGFRMPEPDASWNWLTEVWESRAAEAIPVSWSVRTCLADRWVRFHSLPGSKRYADTEEEYQTLLDRHHQLLADLRSDESEIVAVRMVWSTGSRFQATKAFREAVASWPLWRTFAPEEPEDDTQWYAFAHRLPSTPSALDPLLRRAADDVDCTLFTNAAVDWIYAPYDGGADVIARTLEERDALKSRYSAWLSEDPSGM